MPVKPCAEKGCPRHAVRRSRCREHQITGIYNSAWAVYSRQRRAEERVCALADRDCGGGLTTDHPSDKVLCRVHHGRVEAQRRG